MPNFEVFTRRSRPVVKQPSVAIQRRGNFSINRAAYELLGEPEAVELLFDRTERIMGMRPIDPSTPHAYPVRKQPNSASYLVAGNAFTQFYNIPIGTTRRFDAAVIDGVLAVDLKTEGHEIITHRGRAAETS